MLHICLLLCKFSIITAKSITIKHSIKRYTEILKGASKTSLTNLSTRERLLLVYFGSSAIYMTKKEYLCPIILIMYKPLTCPWYQDECMYCVKVCNAITDVSNAVMFSVSNRTFIYCSTAHTAWLTECKAYPVSCLAGVRIRKPSSKPYVMKYWYGSTRLSHLTFEL